MKLSISLLVILFISLSCKPRFDRSGLLEKTESQKPKVDQTKIKIVMQDDIGRNENLNPYLTDNPAIQSMARFVYEPLALYVTDNPMTEIPIPLLLEKSPEIDELTTSMILTLKKGVMFQQLPKSFGLERTQPQRSRTGINSFGGKAYEMTADDVEFSLLVASRLKSTTGTNWLSGTNIMVERFRNGTPEEQKYKLKVYWNQRTGHVPQQRKTNHIVAFKILSTLIIPKQSMKLDTLFNWSAVDQGNFTRAFNESLLSKVMWGTGPYQASLKRGRLFHDPAAGKAAYSVYLDKNAEYWAETLDERNAEAFANDMVKKAEEEEKRMAEEAKKQQQQQQQQQQPPPQSNNKPATAKTSTSKVKTAESTQRQGPQGGQVPPEMDMKSMYKAMFQQVNMPAAINPAFHLPFEEIEFIGRQYPTKQPELLEEKSELVIAHFNTVFGVRYKNPTEKRTEIRAVPLRPKHMYMLLFDFHDAPHAREENFSKHPLFRQAINHLIDRKAFTKMIGGKAEEHLLPARGFLGPGFDSTQPIDFLNFQEAIRKLKGINLITESKTYWKQRTVYNRVQTPTDVNHNSVDLEINYDRRDLFAQELAATLRTKLRESGLGVAMKTPDMNFTSIKKFDATQGFQRWAILKKVPLEGFPDPRVMWHSKGPGNHMAFSNREIDAAIDALNYELDPSFFNRRFTEIDNLLKKHLPAIPLVIPFDFVGHSGMAAIWYKENQQVHNALLQTLDWGQPFTPGQ